MDKRLLKWVSKLHSISQNGLCYSTNEFERERYREINRIATEMAAYFSDKSSEEIAQFFTLEKGYATPKLDVRAFILKDNKLLLVKERADNLWTLPGGWVEINESPSESIIREVLEETGFNVRVIRLLALWDKLKHNHPPQWPHIYKIFFLCEIVAGKAKENLEISEIDFFPMDKLPELSTPRVIYDQLVRLLELALHSEKTSFD